MVSEWAENISNVCDICDKVWPWTWLQADKKRKESGEGPGRAIHRWAARGNDHYMLVHSIL